MSDFSFNQRKYRKKHGWIQRFFPLIYRPRDEMFWSWQTPLNFGDWIGPLIHEWRTGRSPNYRKTTQKTCGPILFTVGSILHHVKADERAVVWGSGIMFRDTHFPKPLAVHAVRGPITRRRFDEMGYGCPDVFGDPALLLPLIYPDLRAIEKRWCYGVIPHFVNLEQAHTLLAGHKDRDTRVIDVRGEPEQVISEIAQCSFTISSSLHGIIVSHAFGIPTVWVEFGDKALKGDRTKFLDHFAAVGESGSVQPIIVKSKHDLLFALRASRESRQYGIQTLQRGLLGSCPF